MSAFCKPRPEQKAGDRLARSLTTHELESQVMFRLARFPEKVDAVSPHWS